MQFVTPRSVDACIRRIRGKIEPDRARPTYLKTIRGVGYRLDAMTTWQSTPSEGCDCALCAQPEGTIRRLPHASAKRRANPTYARS
jgi:DNA-binding winged helix-turn-helix (wHTH) protein